MLLTGQTDARNVRKACEQCVRDAERERFERGGVLRFLPDRTVWEKGMACLSFGGENAAVFHYHRADGGGSDVKS